MQEKLYSPLPHERISMKNRVIIVGGGAAGMLASVFAAKKGCEVTLFEKNEKLGKKLYITGKGRCNVTNNCEPEELLNSVVTNAKFLYSAFYTFTSQDMMDFLEEAGAPLKTERGNRVFPCSDHSSDIIRALERQMKKYGVRIHLKSQVQKLILEEGRITGISLTDGSVHRAEAVIVATGGLSYPTTGSTGDGYRFAREAGHTVTDLSPSLVPLHTKEEKRKKSPLPGFWGNDVYPFRHYRPPGSFCKRQTGHSPQKIRGAFGFSGSEACSYTGTAGCQNPAGI